MFKWLHHKCCREGCSEVAFDKEEMSTMGGTLRWWYCESHWKEKKDAEAKKMEENKRSYEKRQTEAKRQAYYEWLKREVEITYLEKRANELGLKYDGQV